MANRSRSRVCGLSGSQARFSATRTSREVRTSSGSQSRATSLPVSRVSCSCSFSASSRTSIFTKVSRAWLWGLPVARARSRAERTCCGVSSTTAEPTVSRWVWVGTFCRSRTARRMTSAICSDPLIRATSGSRSGTPCSPGNRSASEDMTTPVSPREGRTRSMYHRNEVEGPTTRTPDFPSRSRWVYSR
ncbi:Uncharacterised protein [Mycobacteroides abscessus subsp. abscessus]|nr:Uncharacterised protein [Mycobacteroides abscessus subsp. abscessus]